MNGLNKNRLKHKFPLNSTWMTDSRPGNKTPGVKFSVESDFQVKNKQFLRLEGKNKEKRNSKNSKKLFFNLLFSFSCFFLSVHRVK